MSFHHLQAAPVPMKVEATRTYLEMASRADLVAAHVADERLRLERVEKSDPALYRYLYAEVGRAYHWVDRLRWTDGEILAHLAQPAVAVWLMSDGTEPAGYFELQMHADRSAEIAYFGLLPKFIGRRLGGHLLSLATERAWETGSTRVWLHTSSLDHPAALSNYVKRGFRPYRTEKFFVDL